MILLRSAFPSPRTLAALLAFSLGMSEARADAIRCPAQVSPPRPSVRGESGWQARWSGPVERPLSSLAVYDGSPTEMAQLVPAQSRAHGHWFQAYDLSSLADNPRPIWIVCRYANTTMEMMRELPRGTRRRVLNARNYGGDNLGLPISASCQ